MKPTTLTALALTLLMFLLVLLSAFLFVFQGQLSLRNELAKERQKVDTLEQEQATLKLNQSTLQEEATRMFHERATAASESVVLTEQLANTDRQLATVEAEADSLLQARDQAIEDREFYESIGPLVKIITPEPFTEANLGEEVTIGIVASDLVGVNSIIISIDDQLLESPPFTPDQVVTMQQAWTPENGGQKRITVRAVNNNNVTSRQSAELIILVRTPTPTSTPAATNTPTLTPVPSPTPEASTN
jgi:hypothetical protein